VKSVYQNYFSNKSNAYINLGEDEDNEKNLQISLEHKKVGKITFNELGNLDKLNNLSVENNNHPHQKNILNNNFINRGNLTTKNSNNGLMSNIKNITTNKKTQIRPNSNNNANISNSKVRVKKVDNNPRHSFNALDLKKAVLQDPSFNKMNYFSKIIIHGPVSISNASNSHLFIKKEFTCNNPNIINDNNNLQKVSGNFNNLNNIKKEVSINLEEQKNKKVKFLNSSNQNGNSTTKNIIKHNSKNTLDKLDDYIKTNNSISTARNMKNGFFVFDQNNKSIHNNSTGNSKDKYFAIVNKRSKLLKFFKYFYLLILINFTNFY
jgi:hypothetical protein